MARLVRAPPEERGQAPRRDANENSGTTPPTTDFKALDNAHPTSQEMSSKNDFQQQELLATTTHRLVALLPV